MGAWITERPDLLFITSGSGSYSVSGPITAGSAITVTMVLEDGTSGTFNDLTFTQGTAATLPFPSTAATPVGTVAYDGDKTFTVSIPSMPSYYMAVAISKIRYNCPNAQSVSVSKTMDANSAYAFQLPSTPRADTPISVAYSAESVSGRSAMFKGGHADFAQIGQHLIWYDGIDTLGFAISDTSMQIDTIAYTPSGSVSGAYGFYPDKSKAPLGADIGVTCAVLLEDQTIAASSEGSLILKIPVATNIDEDNQIMPIGVLGIHIDRDSTEMSAINSVTEYFYTVSDIDEDGYMQVILNIANVPNRSVVFQAPGTMIRLSFIKR